MATTSFKLEVSYSQLAVFMSALQQPFNDWTERHVAQGFAWRPGSVSFKTLVESGTHTVEVVVTKSSLAIGANVIRAIEVPFEVPSDGEIEVASISDSSPLSLPNGMYCLRCEFLSVAADSDQHVRLVFSRSTSPGFAIAKLDDQLSPDQQLLTTAEAAS